MATRAIVMQRKTQLPVRFEITEQTRDALVTCPLAAVNERTLLTAAPKLGAASQATGLAVRNGTNVLHQLLRLRQEALRCQSLTQRKYFTSMMLPCRRWFGRKSADESAVDVLMTFWRRAYSLYNLRTRQTYVTEVICVATQNRGSNLSPMPKRLLREPLIEVIWQAQFNDVNAGELLPGVLYTELKKSHPALAMQRLPAADIPAPLLRINPNLQHLTKLRMEEPSGSFIWQVGDRVVSLNCRKPYVGWDAFKLEIERFVKIIEESGLVTAPARHSLRYLDLFMSDDPPDLSALNLKLTLGDYGLDHYNLSMRVEIPDGEFIHNVQISTPAKADLPGGQLTGTLVDMETVPRVPPDCWDSVCAQLEALHSKSKGLFFHHVLSKQALEKLEPEY